MIPLLLLLIFFLDYDFLINLFNCNNQSDGVAGILHTILFHRALGLVRPKDVDLELFDVTYVRFQSQFNAIITCVLISLNRFLTVSYIHYISLISACLNLV